MLGDSPERIMWFWLERATSACQHYLLIRTDITLRKSGYILRGCSPSHGLYLVRALDVSSSPFNEKVLEVAKPDWISVVLGQAIPDVGTSLKGLTALFLQSCLDDTVRFLNQPTLTNVALQLNFQLRMIFYDRSPETKHQIKWHDH